MTAGEGHVIGAGLAGLSAAVALAGRGVAVDVIEAAAQAGGRCRSYFDPELGRTIDNGNHLVLSGNRAVQGYLKAHRRAGALAGPEHAEFAFVDLRTASAGPCAERGPAAMVDFRAKAAACRARARRLSRRMPPVMRAARQAHRRCHRLRRARCGTG